VGDQNVPLQPGSQDLNTWIWHDGYIAITIAIYPNDFERKQITLIPERTKL
jgi:hypothetical protein